ncbi:MAG TPA: hypothetical protein VMI13_03925 [Solirubrobacteraceae bacterium]|nr:hypothetical protein [Solirubrobacteraceae bacterium]
MGEYPPGGGGAVLAMVAAGLSWRRWAAGTAARAAARAAYFKKPS